MKHALYALLALAVSVACYLLIQHSSNPDIFPLAGMVGILSGAFVVPNALQAMGVKPNA